MVAITGSPKMAKWVYVFLITVIIATGFAMIFKLGYEPAPVLVMKPSKFSRPEDIGAVIYRRFYAPIEQSRRVVIGVPPSPDWHRDVVRGFLQEAARLGYPFEVLITEEQMPPLNLEGLPPMDVRKVPLNTPALAEFGDQMLAARESGKRTLVYTVNLFSSHLLADNPLSRYEKATGEHLLSITTAPLALKAAEENIVSPHCVGTERDGQGTAALGCEILKAGRGFYRKKIEADQFVAIMNSPRLDDYLLMIAAPGQGAVALKQ